MDSTLFYHGYHFQPEKVGPLTVLYDLKLQMSGSPRDLPVTAYSSAEAHSVHASRPATSLASCVFVSLWTSADIVLASS